jgi:hypothetical protein
LSKATPTDATPAAIRALVAELVDYAGLFPPAQLGMAEAMDTYAEYLRGPHAWVLGRFVVPLARIPEFEEHAARLLPRGKASPPWRLAGLAGDDLKADVQGALEFNCRHWEGSEVGHAVIDTIETRLSAGAEPADLRAAVPDAFTLYIEVPAGSPGPVVDRVRQAGARAKMRMGGVTPEAFPSPDAVIEFMARCVDAGVSFKATAGLHHLIRADYPLTYERDSARAPMYGFINVFLAAAALASGVPRSDARDILMESDLSAFAFDDSRIAWRGVELRADDIARARSLATSYGSCSFREPVDELLAAGLLR